MTDPAQHLLTRDGHLSELSINRHLLNELGPEERDLFITHLNACAHCQARLKAISDFDQASLKLPLFDSPPEFLSSPETSSNSPAVRAPRPPPVRGHRQISDLPRWGNLSRRRALGAAAALLAVFALSYLFTEFFIADIAPGGGQGAVDDVRIKGSPVGLQIHRQGPVGTSELGAGSVVHPGDRLAFMISTVEPGFLLVVGIDETLNAYVCAPSHGSAFKVGPDQTRLQLPGSLTLDGLLGQERIIAVRCSEPFDFDAIKARVEDAARRVAVDPALPLPTILEGCQQHDINLKKIAPRSE